MSKKKVVLICGAGIATSTMVASKIEKVLADNGIAADLSKGSVLEASRLVEGADLLIVTTAIGKMGDIPVINGVPFLTGIGEDAVIAKLLEILKK